MRLFIILLVLVLFVSNVQYYSTNFDLNLEVPFRGHWIFLRITINMIDVDKLRYGMNKIKLTTNLLYLFL